MKFQYEIPVQYERVSTTYQYSKNEFQEEISVQQEEQVSRRDISTVRNESVRNISTVRTSFRKRYQYSKKKFQEEISAQ
jgi:hypothetical protein